MCWLCPGHITCTPCRVGGGGVAGQARGAQGGMHEQENCPLYSQLTELSKLMEVLAMAMATCCTCALK